MQKLIQIKEIILALALFFLPMLIYCHLLFDDSIVTSVEIFEYTYIHRYISDESFAYSLLRFFVPLGLFVILWTQSPLWLKTIFLFPIYIVLWRTVATLTPLNSHIEDIYFQLNVFVLLFVVFFFIALRGGRFLKIQRTEDRLTSRHLAVIILFISLPFIYNLWKLFPEGTSSLDLYFFELKDYGFLDASSVLYTTLQKICFMFPLLIFFLIEKKWWKYALLSPIILYANQIFNIFDKSAPVLDEFELSQSGPFLLVLAVFLVLLSKAVDNQYQIKSFFESIYNQVEEKVSKRFENRQSYIEEKRSQLNQSLSELMELEKLKTELEQELQKP